MCAFEIIEGVFWESVVFTSEAESRVCFLTIDWPFLLWELLSVTTALIWVEQVSYFPPECEWSNILTDKLRFGDGRPDISVRRMDQKNSWVTDVVEDNGLWA